MKIRHNIPAKIAYGNYDRNAKALQDNLQKLSSGYKINKAGDDAAGLAISEKMRAQITGLEGAQKNAKDGISLVQIAEGAMTEIHTMLNRMFSLAEQSANGTYDDDVDRKQLDNEFQKLTQEIDRIADATNFNGIKLLNGDQDGSGFNAANDCFHIKTVVATAYGTKDNIFIGNPKWALDIVQIFHGDYKDYEDAFDGELYKPFRDWNGASLSIQFSNTNVASGAVTISGIPTGYKLVANSSVDIQNGTPVSCNTLALPNSGGTWTLEIQDTAGNGITDIEFEMAAGMTSNGSVSTIKFTTEPQVTAFNVDSTNNMKNFNLDAIDLSSLTDLQDKAEIKAKYESGVLTITVGDKEFVCNTVTEGISSGNQDLTDPNEGLTLTSADGEKITAFFEDPTKQTIGSDHAAATDNIAEAVVGYVAVNDSSGGKLRLCVGDSTEEYDNIYVNIKSMKAAALKGKEHVLEELNVLRAPDADTAMTELKEMINYVSGERGNLGATQNRLDHTINNLSTMQENIQNAESTIRDVDVAEEMMKYTKNNILVQSAQAMLAQANQLPQGVLQLLG